MGRKPPSTEVHAGQTVRIVTSNGDPAQVQIRLPRRWLAGALAAMLGIAGAVVGWIENREGKLERLIQADVTSQIARLEARTTEALRQAERTQSTALARFTEQQRTLAEKHHEQRRAEARQILRELLRTRRAAEGEP